MPTSRFWPIFQGFNFPLTEFKILADFKILSFQNPEFKIQAEFKILAFKILNSRFWPISIFYLS